MTHFLRKIYVPFLASVVVCFFTYLAFRCTGYDWGVSEAFAETISTTGFPGARFPYFSYFYNGGVYLFHDPQAFVTSPLLQALVHLVGAKAAPRWLGVVYAVMGFSAIYAWLRSRFSRIAAGFGALAFTLSLGMFWRMVAGHMLFLLEMILPCCLLAFTRIAESRTWRETAAWSCGLALAGAGLVYEPGFHALFYFILPGVFIDLVLRFLTDRANALRLVRRLAFPASLALLMILPKILAWSALSMSRPPDATDGALALKDVLLALFLTARSTVMGFHVPNSHPERWHFIFEVNTALMPIASFFAIFALSLVYARKLYRERIFLFAVICVGGTVLLAGNQAVWNAFQKLTSNGFRVPSRFLGLGAFGLMVLSTYGVEEILRRFFRSRRALGAVFLVTLVGLAAHWIARAERGSTLSLDPLPLFATPSIAPRFRLELYCPVASGCLNTYQSGYADDPYVRYLAAQGLTAENLGASLPKRVRVSATELKVTGLSADEVLDLPLRGASFGHRILTEPPGLRVDVSVFEGHLRLRGDPAIAASWVSIRPLPPFPLWSAVLAGAVFILTLFGGISVRLFGSTSSKSSSE